MDSWEDMTPREKLRKKISEKKKNRSGKNVSIEKNNFNERPMNGEKVLGFRKQKEFGLKKRIKP